MLTWSHTACHIVHANNIRNMLSTSLQSALWTMPHSKKNHSSEHKRICTRSLEAGRPKRLYFVSSGVKHLLQNDDREALKVTMTGLKVFERQELKVGHVLCQQCTAFCPFPHWVHLFVSWQSHKPLCADVWHATALILAAAQ